MTGLVPGPYRLTAVLRGFRRLTQEDLVLRVGATLTVDLTLQVGAVEEGITITAQAPQAPDRRTVRVLKSESLTGESGIMNS